MKRAAKLHWHFVTTDYILDETATLLRARGYGQLRSAFFDSVFASRACRVEWMDADRFSRVMAFFLKNNDKGWSFTDCFSFCLMHELRLREALSKDVHFSQAGFVAVLAGTT